MHPEKVFAVSLSKDPLQRSLLLWGKNSYYFFVAHTYSKIEIISGHNLSIMDFNKYWIICFLFWKAFDYRFISCPLEPALRRHTLNCSLNYLVLLCGGRHGSINGRHVQHHNFWEQVILLCVVCYTVNKPDVSKYAILGINRSLNLPEAAISQKKNRISFESLPRKNLDTLWLFFKKILSQTVRAKFTYYNFFFRDIMSIYNEPPPGMCIVPDKEDITKVCMQ